MSTKIESSSNWVIDENVRKLIDESKGEIHEAKEHQQNRVIKSPIDGSPSRFLRYEGSHGRVRAIFKSESGDEFLVG